MAKPTATKALLRKLTNVCKANTEAIVGLGQHLGVDMRTPMRAYLHSLEHGKAPASRQLGAPASAHARKRAGGCRKDAAGRYHDTRGHGRGQFRAGPCHLDANEMTHDRHGHYAAYPRR